MEKISITTSDLLNVVQTAGKLAVSRVHVWRLTQAHRLHPIYLGNRPYYSTREVTELANERATRKGEKKDV